MLSANSLLSKGNPKVAPNVGIELRDPMYNPSTPKIGDDNTKFVKDARSLRMKDRFYVDMTLNSYSKNGDGYTLGQNNKGFKAFLDYDRAIDPNLLIRRDPNTQTGLSVRPHALPAGHPQGYQNCFNDFAADVYAKAGGGADPEVMPTIADGYRAAVITEAVLKSYEEQSWVDVAQHNNLGAAK